MRPDLYLMRHGETRWNAQGRLQGRLDSPLTALGRQQARQQAQLLHGIEGQRFSSPQGRAVATAEIAFAGAPFQTDPRLVEIDIGDWSGHRAEILRERYPGMFAGHHLAWYDRAPGGEGFAGLRQRVAAFLDEMTQPALIVTHGITLRMLCLLAMAAPLDGIAELPVEQGVVHRVRQGRHEVLRLQPD